MMSVSTEIKVPLRRGPAPDRAVASVTPDDGLSAAQLEAMGHDFLFKYVEGKAAMAPPGLELVESGVTEQAEWTTVWKVADDCDLDGAEITFIIGDMDDEKATQPRALVKGANQKWSRK